MTDEMSFEQAYSAAQAAVETYGSDYVYSEHHEGCYYLDDDNAPACIVGHVLVRVYGRAGAAAIVHTEDSNYNSIGTLAYEAPGLRLSQEAQDFLIRLQNAQDTGNTWGEALAAAARPTNP